VRTPWERNTSSNAAVDSLAGTLDAAGKIHLDMDGTEVGNLVSKAKLTVEGRK
jgi:hypothetical protein